MPVEFKDNSIHVNAEIDAVTTAWLYEAASEIEARAKMNTASSGGSGLKDKWKNVVDEKKGEAVVGHPWQLAIWYEFGTGSHALNGDGRKGWWVYVKDDRNGKSSEYVYKGGKAYTKQDAISIARFLREKGLDAHATDGMQPHRPLQKAFETARKPLIELLESRLKGMK